MTASLRLAALVLLVPLAAFGAEDRPTPVEAVSPEQTPAAPADKPARQPVMAASPSAPSASGFKPSLSVGGFARVGFLAEQSDPVVDYIGHSNGLRIGAARVELDGRPLEKARTFLSVEAALDRSSDRTGVTGDKVVALKDVYGSYEIAAPLVITIGQFQAPFTAEGMQNDAELVFFDRSIVSRGILPPEGYAADGLNLDRQVGIMLASRRLALGPAGVAYALGIFNGNGANRILNDNDSLAPVGRVTFDFQEMIFLGAAGYLNDRTVGVRPDLLQERDVGFTADLSVKWESLRVLASYTQRTRKYLSVNAAADEKATGLLAQAAWRHDATGLELAYRLAQLDPSSLSTFEKVLHHTLGLNWRPEKVPLRVFGAFTLRTENDQRALRNNELSVGGQFNF